MNGTRILWRNQAKILNNHAGKLDFATSVRVAVFLIIVWIFLLCSYQFCELVFRFLEAQKPLGPVLNTKLLSVALLGCLMILVFSNMITSLSVLYLSRDTQMLFGFPLHPFQVFLPKFFTSVFVGSWTVLCLLLPLCAAYGHAKEAGWSYYVLGGLVLIPYVLIAAGIGISITMFLARFLPARRSRMLVVLTLVALIVVVAVWMRASGMTRMTKTEVLSVIDQYMYVKLGMVWYLPSYWVTQVLEGLTQGHFDKWSFFLVLLFSTASIAVLPPLWFGLDRRVYYTGWSLTQEAGSQARTKRGRLFSALHRLSPFLSMRCLTARLKPSTRALIRKDFKMFCRDMTQWAQFMILISLIVVYFVNTRNLPFDTENHFWKNVLGFVNLAMTGFVLATLSIRFFFPLVSLEGRTFWLIGAAPISRRKFLWLKLWPSLLLSAVLGISLICLSNRILQVDWVLGGLTLGTVLVMSVTLTSLCLGLGACFPRFEVRSAAEIASGAGGILAMVLGLLYVGGVIALEAGPMQQLLATKAGPEWFLFPWVRVSLLGVLIWSGLFATIPLCLATRSLSRRDC